MTRAAEALIDLKALQHNFRRARRAAPAARVMAVIKADAYGHGMRTAAHGLTEADAFAVTFVNEALSLRESGIPHPMVALQGCRDAQELSAAAEHGIGLVLHHRSQLELLDSARLKPKVRVWLKVDTGMHRLGFPASEARAIHRALQGHAAVAGRPGLLTHLACADERNNPCTQRQIQCFDAALSGLDAEHSMANSAAILGFPATHRDWVRPGIMLYGASPFVDADAAEQGLRPVMTLRAPLISVKRQKRGDAIGYGATYVCAQEMRVGIAAVGYGDGYPRHAPSGTPVLVNGRRAALAGRVSMDMITIDLRGVDRPKPGDEVILWGRGLAVDEVARCAGTISYELLCHTGALAHRVIRS